MSSPVTARGGIVWAGVGMLVATLITFLRPGMSNYVLMTRRDRDRRHRRVGRGKRVAMTDMPQMIALYNGMGGGAAGAIAAVELFAARRTARRSFALGVLGGIIGAVSFSGSLIAFGKLQGLIKRSVPLPRPELREPADARRHRARRRDHRGCIAAATWPAHVTLLFVLALAARRAR